MKDERRGLFVKYSLRCVVIVIHQKISICRHNATKFSIMQSTNYSVAYLNASKSMLVKHIRKKSEKEIVERRLLGFK